MSEISLFEKQVFLGKKNRFTIHYDSVPHNLIILFSLFRYSNKKYALQKFKLVFWNRSPEIYNKLTYYC